VLDLCETHALYPLFYLRMQGIFSRCCIFRASCRTGAHASDPAPINDLGLRLWRERSACLTASQRGPFSSVATIWMAERRPILSSPQIGFPHVGPWPRTLAVLIVPREARVLLRVAMREGRSRGDIRRSLLACVSCWKAFPLPIRTHGCHHRSHRRTRHICSRWSSHRLINGCDHAPSLAVRQPYIFELQHQRHHFMPQYYGRVEHMLL
jgi:hypothetical protein